MRSSWFLPVLAFAAWVPTLALAADADVKVSSIGYLPGRVKRASVTATGSSFTVKRDSDNSVVFSGDLGAATKDPDTAQNIAIADFTALTETGKFYVDVPGVGRSVSFPIGNDIYREAFVATMLGFYGWRCNTDVSYTFKGQTYSHKACHMDDGHTDYIGSAGKRDGLKGWHDAGDYGKYTVNAGVTVGSLLAAWEEYGNVISTYSWPIPETGGTTPDFLDEIRWELEWVLKMQYSATDGRVSHKLTSINFDAPSDAGGTGTDQWVMPENDNQTRYFVPSGSAAIADFVAMLAKAARIYKTYDQAFADKCLAAAKVSYAYLQANTANQSVTDPTKTGGYGTTDSDDRLWAAAEMWETTGDAAALADFETRAAAFKTGTSSYVDTDFDWGTVKNLGMFIYLQSKRSGRNQSLVTNIQQALMSAADTLVSNRNKSGYGRAISGKSGNYYWGSNGSVPRTCMLLQLANRLAPKADYLDTCFDQIAWTFGRNYYNRSQVTGLGIDPPMNPHHRPSRADGIANPWPGLLVGGGNSTSTQSSGNKNGSTNWIDDIEAYELNEVAINWNAPLVYALASFLDAQSSTSNTDAGVTPDASSPLGGSDAGTPGQADAAPRLDTSSTMPDAPVASGGTVATSSKPSSSQASGGGGNSGSGGSGGSSGSVSGSGSSGSGSAGGSAGSGKSGGCGCSLGSQPSRNSGIFLMLVFGAGLLSRVRRPRR